MKAVQKYVGVLAVLAVLVSMTGCGASKEKSYESAKNLYFYGQYSEARKTFRDLEGYQDSEAMITACDYQLAMKQLSEGEYLGASTAFAALGEYGNAKGLSKAAAQLAALEQYNQGDTTGALDALQGTKLAQDLESGRESQQELKDVAGAWVFTLDSIPYFQRALEVRANTQDVFSKDFCKDFSFKDLSAKVELKIDEDGLAVLTLSDEDLDRLKKSFSAQLHNNFVSYYDGVVEAEIVEMEISREEFLENYEASDNAGVFEVDYKMTMSDFESRLDASSAVSSMKEVFSGSGVALAKGGEIIIRFPQKQWQVTVPQDGKLSLTDGETTLSFTKQP